MTQFSFQISFDVRFTTMIASRKVKWSKSLCCIKTPHQPESWLFISAKAWRIQNAIRAFKVTDEFGMENRTQPPILWIMYVGTMNFAVFIFYDAT